jgi:hypothetical protein
MLPEGQAPMTVIPKELVYDPRKGGSLLSGERTAPQSEDRPMIMNQSADYEICHTVTDWYDGPRGGIADFCSKPHLFQSNFIDSAPDDATEVFLLVPLDPDVVQLALEDWCIWRRWETAFYSNTATQATHPALPS